jgi:DNA-binding transcriptional LysR family regulator
MAATVRATAPRTAAGSPASARIASARPPAHLVAVASPGYLAGGTPPADPAGLGTLDGIVMRSARTGRVRHRVMRDAAGAEMAAPLTERIVLGDPRAVCRAALMDLGVALLAVPDALPHLESGALVRLLPRWYADAGAISLYYATRTFLPAKTRVFVDFMVAAFRRDRLAERFAGIRPQEQNPPTPGHRPND